jgi:predicted murein hydrolase (TIGR00659 family)
VTSLWVYLEASPLLFLTLTLGVYVAADAQWKRLKNLPLLHPVLVSIVVIVVLLKVTNTPYERYFAGAQFVHFLLGPATVALAIPLYHNFGLIQRFALPIGVAAVTGSLTSAFTGVWLARILGAPPDIIRSMAAHSVTAPVAMAISERLGGAPSLTAVLVILTGVTGAVIAPIVFGRGTPDWRARGLAIGTASHGIGTARALLLNQTAGAFSGLAMGLNATTTSLLLPLVAPWLFR